MREIVKKLRPEHKAWLHAKTALLVWAILFYIYTPKQVENVLGYVLTSFVSAAVVIGILCSIFGLVLSLAFKDSRAHKGVSFELFGLWLALSGPVAYTVVQLYLAFTLPDGDQRIALVALAYSIAALILVRIIMVQRYRKRGH